MPEQNIYNLKLHDSAEIQIDSQKVKIVKVPGGWVYLFDSINPVFVPFFKPKKSWPSGIRLLKGIFDTK